MVLLLKRLYFIFSWVWILVSVSFLLFGYVKHHKKTKLKEQFSAHLIELDQLNELDYRVKKRFEATQHDTVYIAHYIDSLLKKRFYHGYSEVDPSENWIAFVAGKTLWQNILYHTRPEKIIQYPMAACSQQGILFQDQLQKLGITFATTAMYKNEDINSGHYAVSVFYNGGWHFYDSNMEADFDSMEHPSYKEMIRKKLYKKAYKDSFNKKARYFFENRSIKRININKIRGKNMAAFHIVTEFLSKYVWLLLLGINLSFIYLKFKTKKSQV